MDMEDVGIVLGCLIVLALFLLGIPTLLIALAKFCVWLWRVL